MKRIVALLGLVWICAGLDCEGNMPDPATEAPLTAPDPPLLDGAYAGPTTNRTTVSSEGFEPSITSGAAYRIVEIVGGRIETVRRAPDRNGPFSCESIEPGSQRICAVTLGGLDANNVETIVETTALGFDYVVSRSIDGELPLTGEGSTLGTPRNGGIALVDTNGLTGFFAGQMVEITSTATGFFQRIGDNGIVPFPDGMNGVWTLIYTEGGQDGIEIRGLRVTLYSDVDGAQEVTDSDPVSASTSPGDGVFFSFEAITRFQSDPAPRLYSITFRGEVGPNGQITGDTSFVVDGKDPIESGTTLERLVSPDC